MATDSPAAQLPVLLACNQHFIVFIPYCLLGLAGEAWQDGYLESS